METTAAKSALTTGTTHTVVITYEEGSDEANELTVTKYPPKILAIGDKIEFASNKPGTLTLTFNNGSNFSDNVVESDETGKVTVEVTRLMTSSELATIKGEYKDLLPPGTHLRENAFPFKCQLRGRFKSGALELKKGGFPAPPHAKSK